MLKNHGDSSITKNIPSLLKINSTQDRLSINLPIPSILIVRLLKLGLHFLIHYLLFWRNTT